MRGHVSTHKKKKRNKKGERKMDDESVGKKFCITSFSGFKELEKQNNIFICLIEFRFVLKCNFNKRGVLL